MNLRTASNAQLRRYYQRKLREQKEDHEVRMASRSEEINRRGSIISELELALQRSIDGHAAWLDRAERLIEENERLKNGTTFEFGRPVVPEPQKPKSWWDKLCAFMAERELRVREAEQDVAEQETKVRDAKANLDSETKRLRLKFDLECEKLKTDYERELIALTRERVRLEYVQAELARGFET